MFSVAVNSLCIYVSGCGSWWLSEVLSWTFSSTLVLRCFIKNIKNKSFHNSDIINLISRSPTLWGNAEQRGILRALNTNVTLMLQSWAHVLSPPDFHTQSIYISLSLTPSALLKVLNFVTTFGLYSFLAMIYCKFKYHWLFYCFFRSL